MLDHTDEQQSKEIPLKVYVAKRLWSATQNINDNKLQQFCLAQVRSQHICKLVTLK